jgi:hypothetical protein
LPRALAPVLALVLAAEAVAGVAAAEPTGGATSAVPIADVPYVTDHVIVRWRSDAAAPTVMARHRVASIAQLDGAGLTEIVTTGGRSVPDLLADLGADPAVASVEPDYVISLPDSGSIDAVPVDDPLSANQYSLDRMMVRDAWSLEIGGDNLIAVLDTGVEFGHPDLAGRLVTGYDFVNNDADANDDNGHGTWVTGIIVANVDNGIGGAGISWSDKVLPVKIMNSAGTGTTSDLIDGIRYAADRGAKVINMSVGGFPYSPATLDAVNYAWDSGAILVGAAGNNAREEVFYPGAYGNVIGVTATQVDDEFSYWSSYGAADDVSAPGASVFTTNCYVCKPAEGGPYTYISGTSFATPNVAGVFALMRARYPTWTNREVVVRMLATVDDLGAPGYDVRYGYGRVNAYRALGGAVGGPAASPGDALEPNNSQGAARFVGLGTIRPSLHPAGDVDWVSLDAPRAGRLDVSVLGMTDARAWPWTRSALPIDPVIEMYDGSGTLLRRASAVGAGATEVASVQVSGPTRLYARISNATPNGNRSAYTITTGYVDNVAPRVTSVAPSSGATDVSRFPTTVATFDEPVAGATASTVGLRDLATGSLVPASVSASGSQVRIRPLAQLAPLRRHRVELSSGVTDLAGNAMAPHSWEFTTGLYGYADIESSAFVEEIMWLTLSGITSGCAPDRFCPTQPVTREQMASFLVRALDLAPSAVDRFTDDEASFHESDINALAASGITGGCATGRFCPTQPVTREQMASFLVRALDLAPSALDRFSDDETSVHEPDINALAASGITGGCSTTRFCPAGLVTREQMAAFLYRALAH